MAILAMAAKPAPNPISTPGTDGPLSIISTNIPPRAMRFVESQKMPSFVNVMPRILAAGAVELRDLPFLAYFGRVLHGQSLSGGNRFVSTAFASLTMGDADPVGQHHLKAVVSEFPPDPAREWFVG